MRERKYRAWNTETGKMIDLHSVTPLALDPTLVALGTQGVFLPFQPHVVIMDYIGLKDINGKEIYESDIVRDGGGYVGVVEWCEHIDTDRDWQYATGFLIDMRDSVTGRDFELTNVEVIGNLYETPHLAPKSEV